MATILHTRSNSTAILRAIVFMFLALLCLGVAAIPTGTRAEPADIDAAARGVVRVVIVGTDGEEVFPLSHGTGFAVSPTRIVTNAHVVREALQDDTLRIGIVPSDGAEAAFGRAVSVSPANDLALVEIVGGLRLPPLTIAGGPPSDSGEVTSVGYPMNVDRAQGLDLNDIFEPQPPVKSRGFLSGARPSRQFDTILHTAPIARGNSGGPLLDGCGRVIGVNSFGADSGGSDAEFFFAVSTRELVPFLEGNDVDPRVNALPCRSLAELNEAERDRIEREQQASRQQLAAQREDQRAERERVRLVAQQEVQSERENAMALAFLLALVAVGAGIVAFQAWQARERETDHDTIEQDDPGEFHSSEFENGQSGSPAERRLMIAGTIAAIAAIAAAALWFTRPGLEEVDRRIAAALQAPHGDASGSTSTPVASAAGTLICSLDVSRSRIVGAPDSELEFEWSEDGCVNGRTQYGLAAGDWSRVFVPNEEDAVSVNIFDPDSRTFRTDRYLLSRGAMAAAREARGRYSPPACETSGAAARLGDLQGSVIAQLPAAPNERLVYQCEPQG